MWNGICRGVLSQVYFSIRFTNSQIEFSRSQIMSVWIEPESCASLNTHGRALSGNWRSVVKHAHTHTRTHTRPISFRFICPTAFVYWTVEECLHQSLKDWNNGRWEGVYFPFIGVVLYNTEHLYIVQQVQFQPSDEHAALLLLGCNGWLMTLF